MEKMWAGRAQEQLDQTADDFNSSIAVDQRMAEQDITGSIAHAKMLAAQGILDAGEVEKIIQGLEGILNDLKAGSLAIDPAAEDIHMFVEEMRASVSIQPEAATIRWRWICGCICGSAVQALCSS